MQTNIIPKMTIRTNLPSRHPPKRRPIIRITPQNRTIDKIRLRLTNHIRSIMRHLRALAITTHTQFRMRAFDPRQFDELGHVFASGGGAAFVETGDVGGVVIYALDCYLGGGELGV